MHSVTSIITFSPVTITVINARGIFCYVFLLISTVHYSLSHSQGISCLCPWWWLRPFCCSGEELTQLPVRVCSGIKLTNQLIDCLMCYYLSANGREFHHRAGAIAPTQTAHLLGDWVDLLTESRSAYAMATYLLGMWQHLLQFSLQRHFLIRELYRPLITGRGQCTVTI